MNTESAIINVIQCCMDNGYGTEMVEKINNVLREPELLYYFNEWCIFKNWEGKPFYDDEKTKYETLKDKFLNILKACDTSIESKIDFLCLLMDPSKLLSKSSFEPHDGSAIECFFHPDISNNETFRHIKNDLFNCITNSKGGKGEYILLIHGLNSYLIPPDEKRGDVCIDENDIEVKNGETGTTISDKKYGSSKSDDVSSIAILTEAMKGTIYEDSGEHIQRTIREYKETSGKDKESKRIKADKCKTINKLINFHSDSTVVKFLKSISYEKSIIIIRDYFSMLYDYSGIHADDIDNLSHMIISNLGTSVNRKIIGDFVFNRYRNTFDAMFTYNLRKNTFSVVPDGFALSDYFTINVSKWCMFIGSDTQGASAGFVNIKQK